MATRHHRFLASYLGLKPGELRIQPRSLRGGLEAYEVAELCVRYTQQGRPRMRKVIVKHLGGTATREARVYEQFVAEHASELAPELFGVQWPREDRCDLYLAAVSRVRAWPWVRAELVEAVLERIAGLHELPSGAAGRLPDWDYEADLAYGARELEQLLATTEEPDLAPARRSLPAVRRLAEALPALRRQLLGSAPFGATVIHGDVHAGNVLVARRGGGEIPLLVDWARTRVGSPLEDVSSWLQSLSFWEDSVRRQHDRLLGTYLRARGMPARPTRTTRDAYWLAAACNYLAGAVTVHLRNATASPTGSKARETSLRAAADCLRVVRRADAVWGGRQSRRSVAAARS